jgi:hypothetical protein
VARADLAYILVMSTHPLEWGWHTSPQTNSSSASEWKPRATLLGQKPNEDGNVDIAAVGDLRCEACPRGGSYGSTAMYEIYGRKMCRSCAVKELGVGNLPGAQQNEHLQPFLIK